MAKHKGGVVQSCPRLLEDFGLDYRNRCLCTDYCRCFDNLGSKWYFLSFWKIKIYPLIEGVNNSRYNQYIEIIFFSSATNLDLKDSGEIISTLVPHCTRRRYSSIEFSTLMLQMSSPFSFSFISGLS